MKKIFPVIFGCLAACFNLIAQVPHFHEYNLLKMNEAIQIKVLFQDAAGYIWVGSNKGLFRFDGINKQHFTKANGLPDDVVSSLAQDSLGNIWTGHANGKLAFQRGETFVEFKPDEGSATAEVSKIHFDKRGILWFSTLKDGLYYYLNSRLYRLDERDGMPDLFVYDFVEDWQGRIWAGTDGGVAIVNWQSGKPGIQTINSSNGLPDNIIANLAIYQDTVWMSTEDQGIFYVTGESIQIKPLHNQWSYRGLRSFTQSNCGIWITTEKGLFITNTKNGQTHPVASVQTEDLSLHKILEDREGNIWIGHQNGLIRCFGNYIQTINTERECGVKNVVSLVADKHGNLWFSGDEGLYKKSLGTQGELVVKKQLVGTRYENLPFISLYADDRENIWAGTYGSGVLKINTTTGAITHIKEEIRNGNVLSIKGKGNEIWLATLGGGSQLIDIDNKITVKNFGREEGLDSDYNYQIFIDSKQRKWFATDGKGARVLQESKFSGFVDSLQSKVLYGFEEDRDGNIWVNAQGEGLFKLDQPKSQWVHFNSSGENNFSSFSPDDYGNLVAIHDLGIDAFDIKTGEVRHFGEEYGIEEMKPNLNAVSRDGDGNIYFGTSNGIVVYSTQLNKLPSKPMVELESLINSNTSIDLKSDINFSYDQNDVAITYTALWFQNPAELSFSYMLENYDDDWKLSRDRDATYSNLPPGEYTFRLRVSANTNFANQKEVQLSFVINPPFWKRIWFYAVIIVAALYLGYWFIRIRERNLVRSNQLLEVKVKERFAQILKKNEEIQAQAEEIHAINENLEKIVLQRTEQLEKKNKALEEAAFINAHKLRAPVASILGLTSLIKRIRLESEDQVCLIHLEQSVQKLDEVVKDISSAIDKADAGDSN